jgi:hypothetical protein
MSGRHAPMCPAIVFSRSDELQIKERHKKVHGKEMMRGIKKELKKLVFCHFCFNRHIQFLLLWRHTMGLLVNKGTGEDGEGSSLCLTGCTILIWASTG